MKALYKPSLSQLAEAQLDVTQVEGVQVETDGRTLWVNINGICVLRVCRFEKLTVEPPCSTFIPEDGDDGDPEEEDLGTPDEEEESDEDEEHLERNERKQQSWNR